MEEYNQAISKGNIEGVIVALEQLTAIHKNKYQSKLTAAKAVKSQLNTATSSLKTNDYFTAYLSSHSAYRALPLTQSKKLLVETGKKLTPLLAAQLKIEESFKLTPKSIKNQLEIFQKQPANEWDLIEVNGFIENINYSSKLLQDTLSLLSNISFIQEDPELLNWKTDIEQQLFSMIKAKKNLINLAQATSANVLLTINEQLTEESANMLSLIRPSLAEQSLQPIFLKAQEAYRLYGALIENISLSDSTFHTNTHSTWYKNWKEIEGNVLDSNSNFQKYPSNSNARVKQLNFYIKRHRETDFPPEFKYQNINEFIEHHKKIRLILETLAIDKTMISYGLATNLQGKV